MHDAVHDSLSGLPNRELFLDRPGIVAKRATLEPLVRPALLFIDIDKFKSVNASFGLIVGDSLLLTVARRLGRNLGPQDTLARVGGDQFALLLLSQSNPRELAMLAEQVRRSLRAPINIAGQEIVLTASIGIALYDGPDEDPAELLREAEIAMYRAKRGGRRPHRDLQRRDAHREGQPPRARERSAARHREEAAQAGLPADLLSADGDAGGLRGAGALGASRLGALNPSDFVPIAEETDLIVKLGSYVLARAVREASRWQKELPRPDAPLFVSVNVSSRQLFRPDLVKEVRHILARAVMPKGSLRLEITELLVMENPEKATAVLRELSEAGAGLALDDFGTGYSSLSYLNQFTFDTIKVDRSFLQASGENGAGSVILRSVVALAHELGKNVVVEGIETEDDVGLLRTIGCEYGQGFYYGEPMCEREVMQLLKVARRSEQRKKRRGLLRKRERAVAEETAEAPVEAAASPPAADPAPRTAGRPRTAAAATNTAARVSPASPTANGAAAPVPAAASASPGAGTGTTEPDTPGAAC